MLLDLCPTVLSPTSTGKLCWNYSGQMRGSKQHFGPRSGLSLAILGPVRVSGSYSSASGGKVGDSWGQVGLSLKLSWAMLCHVEAIHQILFGHIIGPEMPSPQSSAKILSGFLRAMLAPLGGQVRLSCGLRLFALFAPSWDQLRPSRGTWWCYVGSLYLQNALPHGPRGVAGEIPKTTPKTKSPPKRRSTWQGSRNATNLVAMLA